MAHSTWEPTYSLPAAADLSGAQFQAVVINGSGLVALCGAGAMPESILDNVPKAGQMARFWLVNRFVGRVRVGAGGVALGALFASDATGKAVAGATGHARWGKALQAGAPGDIITALLDFTGRYGLVP